MLLRFLLLQYHVTDCIAGGATLTYFTITVGLHPDHKGSFRSRRQSINAQATIGDQTGNWPTSPISAVLEVLGNQRPNDREGITTPRADDLSTIPTSSWRHHHHHVGAKNVGVDRRCFAACGRSTGSHGDRFGMLGDGCRQFDCWIGGRELDGSRRHSASELYDRKSYQQRGGSQSGDCGNLRRQLWGHVGKENHTVLAIVYDHFATTLRR